MRFSCKCVLGLCWCVNLGASYRSNCWHLRVVYSTSIQQVLFLGEFGLPCCAAALLVWLLALPCWAAAAWCNGDSGVAEHLEQDLCYLQAHAVQ